ncbi:hypothetical protein BAUCODRAFT_93390, partial [Baudoinia panamericana UAMH 10762]
MSLTFVLYPKGTNFNMDYYISTHMKMVGDKLSQYGLKGWKVSDFGKDAEYCVGATLEWESMEAFQKGASSDDMKTILDDVKNFSDKEPMLMPG